VHACRSSFILPTSSFDRMRVITFDTPAAFADRVTPLLVRREAENNLILGRLSEFASGDAPAPGTLLLSIEEDGGGELPKGEPVAAAVMVPPNPLVMTRASTGAIDALVRHLVEQCVRLPAVAAPDATARAFALAWSAATGASHRSEFALGLFQLTKLEPPPVPAPGHFRPAVEADVNALVPWADAFFAETRHTSDARGEITQRVREGRLFLWCGPAGDPVCMAGCAGPTPNGIRVNFVYTPPEHRGRGYATTCVAALTRRLLDSGRTFCFLFTNLENPAPNRIYPRLGYRHVCDFRHVRFEPAGDSRHH
jgi:predicted GNAT family acetyltransferase